MTYPFESSDTEHLIPLLADSIVLSSDGLTYTFALRQGITFHDGTPFNASSVQMNIWRMLGRGWDDGFGPVWMLAEPILGGQAVENAVFEYGDGSIEHLDAWVDWLSESNAIAVLDELTIQIRLAYSYEPFLSILALPFTSMISPTFFMAHGGMYPTSENHGLDDVACGTGPYELVEWTQNERIELIINGNYWRASDAKWRYQGAGTIENVTILVNPDENAQIINIKEGITDGCDWPFQRSDEIWNGVTEIGNGTLQSSDPNLKLWAGYPKYSIGYLGFNVRPYFNLSGGVLLNPWHNYNARRAISSAFNLQMWIDDSYNGWAESLIGVIPRGLFGHVDDIPSYSYNLSKAVEFWNLAMTSGLDDIWANNSYEYDLYALETSTYITIVNLIKEGIQQILEQPQAIQPSSELTINIHMIEWTFYFEAVRNNLLPIYTLGWIPDFADPHNYVNSFVKSSEAYPVRMGLYYSIGEGGIPWDSELIDELIDEAMEEQNKTTRLSLYRTIQYTIANHCVYFGGWQVQSFHVERHEMNGYVYNPMRKPYFYHYYKLNTQLFLEIPIEVLIASSIVIGVIAIVILKKSSKE